jgi:hypothetical protein
MIAIVAGGEDVGLDSPGRAHQHGLELWRMFFKRGRDGERRHEVPSSAAAGDEDDG